MCPFPDLVLKTLVHSVLFTVPLQFNILWLARDPLTFTVVLPATESKIHYSFWNKLDNKLFVCCQVIGSWWNKFNFPPPHTAYPFCLTPHTPDQNVFVESLLKQYLQWTVPLYILLPSLFGKSRFFTDKFCVTIKEAIHHAY